MSLKKPCEFTDAEIHTDELMKNHTSFGVGGIADYFVTVKSLYSLNGIVAACKRKRIPYKIVGNGTNLLVSDKGYRGCIICTAGLKDVFFKLDEIKVMAGAPLNKLITFAAENSLSGLETLYGIPATVGGAIVMNAGAFGKNVSDCITTVETLKNGMLCRYDKNECRFSYRRSRFFGKKEPIVAATFKFRKADKRQIFSDMKTAANIRKKLQPFGKTCGSVFKNPVGCFAGQLIDSAGFKGYTIGGAIVSEKHANFIVNTGSATAYDIYTLIAEIKAEVKNLYGITLIEEVEYIGEF